MGGADKKWKGNFFSLPDDWANWMTGELEKEKNETAQSSELFAQKIKGEIAGVDEKLDKLMTAYLENALTLAEYQTAKNKLVNQKQSLKDKLTAFEQKANNRFELTEKFLKYNVELANEGTNEEKLHLFKKVGSNFQIKDRTVFFEPRGAWRILAELGFFGGGMQNRRRFAPTIFLVQKPFSKICGVF